MISTNQQLIEISQCPSYLESKTGNRVHVATVYRWVKDGIAGVTLDTIFIGGKRYSTPEALDQFFQESTAAKAERPAQHHNIKADRLDIQAKEMGL